MGTCSRRTMLGRVMIEKRTDLCIRGYDRLAKVYWLLEWALFRGDLQRARICLLHALPECKRMLILGDGDGRYLREFVQTQEASAVISVDQSGQMIERQVASVCAVGRDTSIEWVHDDARQLKFPKGKFDGLSMLFFLDCLKADEVREFLPRFLDFVAPGGVIHFVDFQEPESGWRRLRGRIYLKVMHWFFGWQTGLENRKIVNFREEFDRLSVSLVAERVTCKGLIRSSVYRVE